MDQQVRRWIQLSRTGRILPSLAAHATERHVPTSTLLCVGAFGNALTGLLGRSRSAGPVRGGQERRRLEARERQRERPRLRIMESHASPVSQLIEEWKQEAETFSKRYGDDSKACLILSLVDDLERALEVEGEEVLDLEAAAIVSGYSSNHLRRLIKKGTIPNAGSDGTPLIARCHLPRKPGFGALDEFQGLSKNDVVHRFLDQEN